MSLNGDMRAHGSSSSLQNSATTVIKYEKSSCLFCNEWFDSQTFTEHLIHCGQVLEQCPNSCNAFLPRIRMRAHLKECPLNKQRQSLNKTFGSSEQWDQKDLLENRIQVMEQDVSALRSVLNEEIRQRLHLITDVGNLRKQNQIADDWTRSAEDTLKSLRRQLEEENKQRCFEVEQCQNDFRYCYDVLQTNKNEVQNEVDALQKHINQVSLEVVEHQNLLNDNIMKLEETVVQNEKANIVKFAEVEDYLQELSKSSKTKSVINSDLNVKQASMDYEIKTMKVIVGETEERCDKLEKTVIDLDRKINQTMHILYDLENNIGMHQRMTSVQNSRGHLIWRIRDYSKKLEEAKQYETILHSAMFTNKPFGYALRLDIHLNGKGTWKGRNMIACLNVIAGEYDALLPWPCRLQADIILRDQSGNPKVSQDYIRTIHVRKKSDEYLQTNQFFYIPHKVISNPYYLRNDSIFIEVKVLK